MAAATVETTQIPEEQTEAIENQTEESRWESDWGTIFLCAISMIVVVGCLYVISWQPWL